MNLKITGGISCFCGKSCSNYSVIKDDVLSVPNSLLANSQADEFIMHSLR